eukprot:12779020-Prorocentrum_lima.AAC.1
MARGLHKMPEPQLLGLSSFIDVAQADPPHREKQPHVVEPPPLHLAINEAHPSTQCHGWTLV